MEVGETKIPLKAAFGPKDIPLLQGGSALSEYKAKYCSGDEARCEMPYHATVTTEADHRRPRKSKRPAQFPARGAVVAEKDGGNGGNLGFPCSYPCPKDM